MTVVTKMMAMKVLVTMVKIILLGVCLCEQQAGRQGLQTIYNHLLVLPNQN